jgi:hypothetical protein
MAFEQATIKVEKVQEFETLKEAINRAFASDKVEQFLKRIQGKGLRVRDLEPVIAEGVFESVDGFLKKSGATAKRLYQSLPVSDQAQLREYYLSKVEEASPELRTKFQKIYRYY